MLNDILEKVKWWNTASERCAWVANSHSNGADVTSHVKTCSAGLGSALVQPHSLTIGQHHWRHMTHVIVLDQSYTALVITWLDQSGVAIVTEARRDIVAADEAL